MAEYPLLLPSLSLSLSDTINRQGLIFLSYLISGSDFCIVVQQDLHYRQTSSSTGTVKSSGLQLASNKKKKKKMAQSNMKRAVT